MSLRILLATCLALACFSQIQCIPFAFSCDEIQFTFYNDYNPDSLRAPAMIWDYKVFADEFNDGTSDTFDGILSFTVQTFDREFFNALPYQTGFRCDLDHINDTENPYAAAEYNFSKTLGNVTVNTTRSFFAPINQNWIRVIDTVTHNSSESENILVTYFGDLGSDLSTVYEARSNYYLASSDGNNGTGDTTFAMNFAGRGGGLPKTSFLDDLLSWQFGYKALPAGKQVSIMHILSQGRSVPDVVNSVTSIHQQPLEIYQNLEAEIIPQIQNWDVCGAVFDLVSETTCVTPAQITFDTNIAGRDLTLSNVGAVTDPAPNYKRFEQQNQLLTVPESGEISLELVGGTYEFSWTRAPVCGAKTHSFTARAPQENLAVMVQNNGNFLASATGGYGSYNFEWILNGDKLSSALDNYATVVVTDAQGCSANTTVDLPGTSARVLPTLITIALSVVVSYI